MKYVIKISVLAGLMTSHVSAQQLEIAASIMPPEPDMSGIAVTSDGRVFLGFRVMRTTTGDVRWRN